VEEHERVDERDVEHVCRAGDVQLPAACAAAAADLSAADVLRVRDVVPAVDVQSVSVRRQPVRVSGHNTLAYCPPPHFITRRGLVA